MVEKSNSLIEQLQFGKIHLLWVGSGHMVDNLIHQIDECCWLMDDWPVSCHGTGAREVGNDDHGQNIDTYSMEFTFPNGKKAFCGFRRAHQGHREFATFVHCSKKAGQFSGNVHKATVQMFKDQRISDDNIAWSPTPDAESPWDYEWIHFIDSIRNDKPHNETQRAVYADYASLMGRAAAHSNQIVTWDEITSSKFQFCDYLDDLSYDAPPPVQADQDGYFPAPVAGEWKEIRVARKSVAGDRSRAAESPWPRQEFSHGFVRPRSRIKGPFRRIEPAIRKGPDKEFAEITPCVAVSQSSPGRGTLLSRAGGGGEGYFMDDGEWRAIVELTAAECKGRVPSIAGIFELSAREAVRKAVIAAELGIDFVQIQPPHYMVPTDDEVFEHYRAVNDAADVGIICYNAPWAMPQPGFELTPPLLERLAELDNVEGVKWCSYDMRNFVTCLRLFAERLNFISNQPAFVLSLPIKLGMTGFIDSHGNVSPRLVLHIWDLWKNKRYDEYDELTLRMSVDPFLRVHMPEEIQWRGMGEGPLARLGMEAAGLSMGPSFPAQQPLGEEFIRNLRESHDKSGLAEWVDWQERCSLVNGGEM